MHNIPDTENITDSKDIEIVTKLQARRNDS